MGIFVAVGLAILAALVVQFGRLGEGIKTYYGLTVHFVDASGLLKGSDVLLGGAKVGRVSEPPRLVTSGRGVDVQLRIYDYVRIPAGSSFTIGSTGLLGDRFVASPRRPAKPTAYIAKGAQIEGTREQGFSRHYKRRQRPDQGPARDDREDRHHGQPAERPGPFAGEHGSP